MIQSIKKSMVVLFLVTAFTSCNQGPTLQTYYVDNELKPGFMSFDAPTSLINVEDVEMTDEQREAYKSVDKLNVLAYTLGESNMPEYLLELEKIKLILKDPKYEELMRGGSGADGKFVIKFLGDIESVDELIVFGNSKDNGFLIARILGDNMNAAKLISLSTVLKDFEYEDSQLNGLKDFFK
ncbi:DUF4252 domain-containing protein [Winogradskyella sp. UBA3174]|uniref:DUF4252 domain-containing protein n=1 Tax=Winogradskyella sp. UBA3174 TaxID=1947785 RepID=UPI0025D7425C|nr:DUF4252 domain-containing protein [Winogradskyella sp. UBA3174]|tara:strand:+ start:6427 stop:6972 length:546 start_codon:yes stop_codon:yes gene_type:complete